MDSEAPLVVGANRDERYDRPADAISVLAPRNPRVLGGRDLMAGGTWLAVNEHGLVVGLTNRPSPSGRDPSKRSRGELPLALIVHETAAAAVADFASRFRADDYNSAWLLVGDRVSLFYVEMAETGAPAVSELSPGLYVLGNGPLGGPSPKTAHVRRQAARLAQVHQSARLELLRAILSDHSIPPDVEASPEQGVPPRPPEVAAACVHTKLNGTRSSILVTVTAVGLPQVSVADGPPCRAPFLSADRLWAPSLIPSDTGPR
jgi:uncharacterized protein with NRDE domain